MKEISKSKLITVNKKNNLLTAVKKIIKMPELYIFCILIVVRIIIGEKIGIWFASSQGADDNLLANYSILSKHFYNPDVYSLMKMMSYPIFINLVYFSGIKYTIWLSLLYVIDASLVYSLIKKITKSRIMSIISFVYVLFLPIAFESWLGTRMYRNSIIGPFVLLFLCLLIYSILFYIKEEKFHRIYLNATITGVIFTFTYYIKEDGLWLLACLLFTMFVQLIIVIIKNFNKKCNYKKIIILISGILIPIMIFLINTNLYKAINKHYFGVYEIETKSSGELGKFVANVYKVKSDNRSKIVWAPKDAIEKVFEVSETLKKYPKLEENIFHTYWCDGNIEKRPIHGDFLTWILRSSLEDTGIWKSEQQVNDLFGQVNNELDEAFANGTLEKDNRIQLLSSAGGRTFNEILDLKRIIIQSYKGSVLLEGYSEGCIGTADNVDMETTESYEKKTREKFNTIDNAMQEENNKMINIIFSIYKYINPILFVVMIVVIFLTLIKLLCFNLIKRSFSKDEVFEFLIVFILFGISILYTFAISWFSEFIFVDEIDKKILDFYLPALPVWLAIPYILSLDLLIKDIKNLIIKIKSYKSQKLIKHIL